MRLRKTDGDSAKRASPGYLGSAGEFARLALDYAKQETLGPLLKLQRWMLWGLAGAVAMAVGICLLLLGALRVLQHETGSSLTGHLDWIPYFCPLILGALLALLLRSRIKRGFARVGALGSGQARDGSS